jgi:two-component system LytT family response regulator
MLREHLESEFGPVEIREARNGSEAVDSIRSQRPDLVLLDIQMPKVDGFDVIAEVGVDLMPPVIFVTAFEQHAIRAFEVHAIDYLLKPVDPLRLRDAVEHARTLHGRSDQQPSLRAALDAAMRVIRESRRSIDATAGADDNRIAVRTDGRIYFVRPEEIQWLESHGNYVTLHLRGATLRHRATVEQMTDLLGADFIRIRRSTLVRARAIRACEPEGKGSYVVILEDGTRLQSSRFFRSHLSPLLDR